jgi:hypothetical protein
MTKNPAWTDQLAAWSTLATALLTLLLALMAIAAWRTAKHTLEASRRASEAAVASAQAARAANEQARLDSMEQTRPYVYAEVIPGLAGQTTFDLRITNSGRSAARALTLAYDSWPAELDDVAEGVQKLFNTARTLPPGCSIRSMWRLEGNFDDGTTEAGLGKSGTISLRYTSDDPSSPTYLDSFDVMINNAGLWPVPESGPNPDGLRGDALKFYRLAQTLVRRVGEIGR